MNIVEAFLKFNGQMIIVVSGLSGTGRTELASKLSSLLNFTTVDQKDFYKKNYDIKAKLPNGKEIIVWDSDDAINWDAFNTAVNLAKDNGVVVVGVSFNKALITFAPDYHFHISMPKQVLYEKRQKKIEANKEEHPEEYEEYEDGTARLVMNQITYPYYVETVKNSVVNKFYNTNKYSIDDMYDMSFDTLMEFISKSVYKDQQGGSKKRAKGGVSAAEVYAKFGLPYDNNVQVAERPSNAAEIYSRFGIPYGESSLPIPGISSMQNAPGNYTLPPIPGMPGNGEPEMPLLPAHMMIPHARQMQQTHQFGMVGGSNEPEEENLDIYRKYGIPHNMPFMPDSSFDDGAKDPESIYKKYGIPHSVPREQNGGMINVTNIPGDTYGEPSSSITTETDPMARIIYENKTSDYSIGEDVDIPLSIKLEEHTPNGFIYR